MFNPSLICSASPVSLPIQISPEFHCGQRQSDTKEGPKFYPCQRPWVAQSLRQGESMPSMDRHGSIISSVMRFRLCLLSKSVCCCTLPASRGFVRGYNISDKQRKQFLVNSSAEQITIQAIQQMYYLVTCCKLWFCPPLWGCQVLLALQLPSSWLFPPSQSWLPLKWAHEDNRVKGLISQPFWVDGKHRLCCPQGCLWVFQRIGSNWLFRFFPNIFID